jgi:hypothetical protein
LAILPTLNPEIRILTQLPSKENLPFLKAQLMCLLYNKKKQKTFMRIWNCKKKVNNTLLSCLFNSSLIFFFLCCRLFTDLGTTAGAFLGASNKKRLITVEYLKKEDVELPF